MKTKTLYAEADSLEEARNNLYSSLEEDWTIFSERIQSDGKTIILKEASDSIEEAYQIAESEVPNNASIERKHILIEPTRKTVEIQAENETTARKSILRNYEKCRIESVSIHKKGRKGFLGIGKQPNIYKIDIFQLALVEVRYKEKAKIECEICMLKDFGIIHYKDPSLYFSFDLLKHWEQDSRIAPFGSQFRCKYGTFHVRAGEVEDHLVEFAVRKKGYFAYLSQQGFNEIKEINQGSTFAGGRNVFFFEYTRPDNKSGLGLSAVHYIIQYNVQIDGMPNYIVRDTMNSLNRTFKFAPKDRVDHLKRLYG